MLTPPDPDGAGAQDRWMHAMRRGDFEAAWQVSDALMSRREPGALNRRDQPFHLRHVWSGAPLAGRRVLVRCYHGLGDTIQFVRYMPALRGIAAAVTVQAVPALHGLLATADGIDRIIPLDYDAPDPAFEVDVEIMELPHAFRTTLGSIPDGVPYLGVDASRRREAAQRLRGDARFKVGIAWSAGAWDKRRALPPEALVPLAAIPDVALFNLQRGPALGGLARSGDGVRFADDAASWTDDILDTAATMLNLDLVISVDTMTAHLAGALGVRAWTLLHSSCDWRWMSDRADTPWYPGMRLFRQAAPGEWGPVVAAVAARLRREVELHRRAVLLSSPTAN